MAAPDTRGGDVIPFARPRAISSLPTTFSPAAPVPTKLKPQKKSPRSTPATGVDTRIAAIASTWGTRKPDQAATTIYQKPTGFDTPASVFDKPSLSRTVVTAAPAIPVSAAHAMVTHGGIPSPARIGPAATSAFAMPAPAQAHAAAASTQQFAAAHSSARLFVPAPVVPVAAPFETKRPSNHNMDFAAEGPTVKDAQVYETRPEVPKLAPSRWAGFEKLGLVAKQIDPKQWSKHVVTAYRMLGFAILTIIVIVLIGYITTTAFFYWSDSWLVPMALSPTDEKVVSLQAQLAERKNQRDQTAAALDQAERSIGLQQAFQTEFAKAIKSDLEGRQAALERMHQLANAAAATRASIRRSNNAYATASQQRMAAEWKAGLIDRQAMLSGKFQLAQISTSNLTLVERQAEYESRAADLEAQTRSLEALLANTTTGDPMSYDVLKIKQEYETSRFETQKAIETRDMLKIALAREDKLLASLSQSSYLRAMADNAQVAFVPYGNLREVSKGSSLYGCKLGMIVCHKVGTVLEVLPGEVQFKHPHRDKQLRGQMVELHLEDGAAATDDVLFVGGRPLFI